MADPARDSDHPGGCRSNGSSGSRSAWPGRDGRMRVYMPGGRWLPSGRDASAVPRSSRERPTRGCLGTSGSWPWKKRPGASMRGSARSSGSTDTRSGRERSSLLSSTTSRPTAGQASTPAPSRGRPARYWAATTSPPSPPPEAAPWIRSAPLLPPSFSARASCGLTGSRLTGFFTRWSATSPGRCSRSRAGAGRRR